MPGAVIVADQLSGAGAGAPGVARNDLWQAHQVDLAVATSGNTTFLWELVDKPPGSAAALSVTNTASSTFMPDLVGTYRVRLVTNGGGAGNVQTLVFRVRYTNTGTLANRGWAYPALGEIDGESNYSGNLRSWAQVFENILEDIRINAFTPGVTGGVVLKKTYLQLFDGEVVDNAGGWVRLGTFYWNPTDFLIPASPVVKFSAIGEVNNVANAIELRLWDITAAAPIAGSTLTTSSLTPAYQVSSALIMPISARVLEVQMRSVNAPFTATCTSARLEIHPE